MTDCLTSSNNSSDYQSNSIGVNSFNSNCENPSSKLTYRSPIIYQMSIIFVICFIIGFGLSCFIIYISIHNKKFKFLFYLICSFMFLIISVVIGIKFNFYLNIKIDTDLGIVYIKTIKLFFFNKKSNKIEIKNISQVSIIIDPLKHFQINYEHYDCFKIIFKLLDGKEISGNTLVKEPFIEGNKVYDILKISLPKNIEINNFIY